MSDDQKYTIQGLEEHIRQGESLQCDRGEAWKVVVGLLQVDGLLTLGYLLDTTRKISRVTSLSRKFFEVCY